MQPQPSLHPWIHPDMQQGAPSGGAPDGAFGGPGLAGGERGDACKGGNAACCAAVSLRLSARRLWRTMIVYAMSLCVPGVNGKSVCKPMAAMRGQRFGLLSFSKAACPAVAASRGGGDLGGTFPDIPDTFWT